jgi:membrane fusion protein (multidrug efflux system)
MLDEVEPVSLRADPGEAPTTRRDAPQKRSDLPGERPSAPKKEPRSPRRRWVRWALFALLPLALIAGAYGYVTGGQTMSTDDAYVEADKVGISTDVSGIVQEVDVTENQHVETGQALYRLDDLPFRLALQRAEAQVGIVRNDLNALKANYQDMQSQIRQAQYDIDYYDREFRRQQDLVSRQVVSQSSFDTARRNLQNAQQRLASLNQQLAAIAANLNGDPNIPVEQHPRYLDAVAQRDEAARQLAHTVVKAPFACIVTNVPSIAPGKYLPASMTAFNLVTADHVWVDANPKETELTYVRPGQPVTVTVDTYPDAQWGGTVETISPAAAQEFSLLPAQNTSGNWVKVVQRIPIRVRVDTSNTNLPPLRAGMSV